MSDTDVPGSTWPARTAWGASAAGSVVALWGIWIGSSTRGVEVPAGFEAGPGAAFFVGTLAFTAAGGLLATRRPSNPIGWILLATGAVWQLQGLAGLHRVAVLEDGGSAPWAAWVWDVLWVPGIALVALLFLCFPDGRLPSRRWRPVAVSLATSVVALLVGVGLRPGPLTNTPVDNPLGIEALAGAAPVLEGIGNAAFAVSVLAAVVASCLRYRRADQVQRYQLKWFLAAAVVVVAGFTIGNVLQAVGAPAETLALVRTGPLVALPIAVAVAVLRYRLYDIDAVITRSLLYTGLATLIGLVYLTVVVGVGSLVGGREGASIPLTAAATAIAAIVFQPARQRLQQLANRIVYGHRASPYEVLTSFTERVTGAYPAGEAPDAVAQAVVEGLHVSDCEVWLRVRDELRPVGRWPRGDSPAPIPLAGDEVAVRLPGCDRTYPVQRDGALLGAIGVSTAPGEQLSETEHRLLGDLAAAAWLVLDNAQLVSELRTSRQRLVTAQDTQRRRTERDLHDGAQQRLLELALTLRTAHQQIDAHGPAPVAGTLAAAELQLRSALAELRDLARGIHPAILTERGLVAALGSLAERAPLPVGVDAEGVGRFPPVVESTIYFVAAEAIANVIKHAGATNAAITVVAAHGQVQLTVTDDGCGGADPTRPGLSGLGERVGALDGRLDIVSPPAGGTRLTATLPCG